MKGKNVAMLIALCLVLCAVLTVSAQEPAKPLTNADVIKMVESGLPESVVVSSIQASPAKYDISQDGLIVLQVWVAGPRGLDPWTGE